MGNEAERPTYLTAQPMRTPPFRSRRERKLVAPSRHAYLPRLMLSESDVKQTLQKVKYPGYSRDIVSFGLVKDIETGNGAVTVVIEMTSANAEAAAQIKQDAEAALRELPDVRNVFVQVNQPQGSAATGSANPFSKQQNVEGIQRVIAVASGKGGVGKSTVSVNLACALQQLGARVGLLDCDIYGPSIPLMMGVHEKPTISPDEKLVPPTAHEVRVMSMGLLLDGDQPVIWRGPMIQKTIQQFLHSVDWGTLDYLLVDLPPGTGDAQLSLCQMVHLDGGVIVSTPQEASLGVVRKGISMFEKVNVPLLGIVENMSYFTAPNGERVEIFGHGGGRAEAERQEIPFLGEVPIFTEIRQGGDQGVPVVVSAPQSTAAQSFTSVAQALQQRFSAANP